MSYRTTAIFLALLAIAAGYMYFLNPKEKEPEAVDTSDLIVLNLETGTIRSLEVRREEQAVVVKRNPQGGWDLAQPEQGEGDQPRIANLVETFAKLRASRAVSDEASNLADFGLDKPNMRVILGVGSNDTMEILVGNKNPAGTGGYVKRADSDKVWLVGSYDLGLLESLLFELPKAKPTPTPFS